MKKLLKEYNEAYLQIFKTAPNLAGASAVNCFNKSAKPMDPVDKVTGKPAMYLNSTDPANKDNPHIFYFNDFTKEKRNAAGVDGYDPKKTKVSKWGCNAYMEKTAPPTNPINKDIVDALRQDGWVMASEISGADTRSYDIVNIKNALTDSKIMALLPQDVQQKLTEPQYRDQFVNDFLMMKQAGKTQRSVDKNTMFDKCIKKAGDLGFKDFGGERPTTSMAVGKDLNTIAGCKDVTRGEYKVYQVVQPGRVISSLFALMQPPSDEQELDIKQKEESQKDRCRSMITLYHEAAVNKEDVDQEELDTNIKPAIKDCATVISNSRFLNPTVKPKLEKIIGVLNAKSTPTKSNKGRMVNWGLKVGDDETQQVTESFEYKLRGIIRENLLVASENKRKKLLQENRIVKNRFKILKESNNLRTKKGQKKFAIDLMTEMIYLNQQGFDKQIINETLWDTIKGLFGGGHTTDAIFDYAKEWMIQSLLERLEIDPKGWIGASIISAIGNLNLGEIPKLTDCNFLTRYISKSLAEGMVVKLQGQTVGLGPVQSILRNVLVDNLAETDLGQKIEGALGSLLCPIVSGFSAKMDNTSETMKSNALGMSNA